MTKEELRKEATEYALEWGDKTDGTYACCRDGYLAGAEPREKRIIELENENELLKNRTKDFFNQILGMLIKYEDIYERFPDLKEARDKAEFILQENTELKEQIEKMKCCYNCKHSRTEYEHCRTDKHEKWEIKEK